MAVACGVAVGTAVLTGALLVGDSMQGSLSAWRAGLGRIDEVLLADHFFREDLSRPKDSHGRGPCDLYAASMETVARAATPAWTRSTLSAATSGSGGWATMVQQRCQPATKSFSISPPRNCWA